jgi:hypothetical protein
MSRNLKAVYCNASVRKAGIAPALYFLIGVRALRWFITSPGSRLSRTICLLKAGTRGRRTGTVVVEIPLGR